MSAIRQTITAAVTGALNGKITRIDGAVMRPNIAVHAARAYMKEWAIPETEVSVAQDEQGVSIGPAELLPPVTPSELLD